MTKIKKFLALLVVSPLFLGACVRNNGYCGCSESEVKDENNDGICDICGLPIVGYCGHADADGDGYCDICGHEINAEEGGEQGGEGGEQGGGSQGGGEQGGGSQGGGGSSGGGGSGGGGSGGGGDSSGGGGQTPDTPAVDPNVEVTTYLVLSSVGLYEGQPGMTIGAKHLENAIAFVALPGSALPGADKVTHSYGSATFTRWLCYEGGGAPTVYTTVPYAVDKILYADFTPNGQDPVTPDPSNPDPVTPEIQTTTYYLNTAFKDGSGDWDVYGAQNMWAYVWNNNSENRAYQMVWDHDRIWKVDIQKDKYTMIIFCRVDPTATTFSWENGTVYNQTIDLAFVAGKTTAQLLGWGAGYGAQCPVEWVS